MNEKELIQKLNSLKEIKPDNSWKHQNREILYSQVKNSAGPRKQNIFVSIREFFAQPSFAIVSLVAFLIVGSFFSVRAVNLRPGDSLYIAQVISEKAQLAITFDQEKRSKMEMQFASDRAKMIARVLAEANLEDESNEKSIKLTEDFKREINIVKNKIQEMKLAEESKIASGAETENREEDVYVMGASLGKDEQGLEFLEAPETEASQATPESGGEAVVASSELEGESDEGGSTGKLDNTHKKLEEAEELFDQKDYNGAFSKLEEIDSLDTEGKNSNPETSATSTEE